MHLHAFLCNPSLERSTHMVNLWNKSFIICSEYGLNRPLFRCLISLLLHLAQGKYINLHVYSGTKYWFVFNNLLIY